MADPSTTWTRSPASDPATSWSGVSAPSTSWDRGVSQRDWRTEELRFRTTEQWDDVNTEDMTGNTPWTRVP